MAAETKIAIGIDLGTTYSCVGVFRDGRVDIIANQFGERTTPSVVAFTDKERLVGMAAANQAARNPQNTVFDAKRLIGRRFSDEVVQSDKALWPFRVVRGEADKPMIEVQFKGETLSFSPEQISAAVLQYMKQTASDFMSQDVTDAVITCPAYFSNEQRQATKDAGVIAGLNVLRIINEPTAAALAYGLNTTLKKGENHILVYDFGGGTLDCSILSIDDGVFEVKATGGDTHLGGEDIDNILVAHFAEEFKRKHKEDLTKSDRALRRLRTACERLKRTLSSSVEAPLEIESLYEGIDFYTRISRARFNELCSDIWLRGLAPIDTVLSDAGMKKTDIHEIVLVGGSTKIPQIQELISAKFGGKTLNRSINPDEAIAYGATVQASILNSTATGKYKDTLLMDVTSLSVGLEAAGGQMKTVVRRGTTIPCEVGKIFSTNRDNQDSVTVKVYEGERPATRDNNLLGSFVVNGIPPMPRAKPQIEVKFSIDADGLLTVKAEEKTSGVNASVTIDGSSRLTDAQIQQMLKEADAHSAEDALIKETSEWSNIVESFAMNMRVKADDPTPDPASGYLMKDYITDEERSTLVKTAGESLTWLEQHSNCSLDELKDRQRHQEQIYANIISSIGERMRAAYLDHVAKNPPQPSTDQSQDGCGDGSCGPGQNCNPPPPAEDLD